MAKRLRLNVGSGGKAIDGWVSIDAVDRFGPCDVHADILHLPYDDEVADAVMAIHVIEHFYLWEAGDALKEWVRVLKPGGELILEAPDLSKLFALALANKVSEQMLMARLYGDHRWKEPGMAHKWCWHPDSLKKAMEHVGLKDIEVSEPEYHIAAYDMRLTGRKCA